MPSSAGLDLPAGLQSQLEEVLGQPVLDLRAVSGGCIASALKLKTPTGFYFLKYGSGAIGAAIKAEERGLRELVKAGSPIRIPRVAAAVSSDEGVCGLVMEWVERGQMLVSSWSELGAGLAVLHRMASRSFGFTEDNFIGASPQANNWNDDWAMFFIQERLVPQIQLAKSNGVWSSLWQLDLSQIQSRLNHGCSPSLVHGDLWSGNVMADSKGFPVLIDPAVYYGDREVDLAMSRLFGAFDAAFYQAYSDEWPLPPDWEQRVEIYNLYHLINHLNLFGSSYAGAVEQIVRRFSR